MERFVEFDFTNKIEREIPLEDVKASIERGGFVWLDVETEDRERAHHILHDILGMSGEINEVVLRAELDTGYDQFPNCLHMSVVSCRLEDGAFRSVRVDVVVGEKFLLTLSRAYAEFLGQVRRAYRSDFLRFAKSPSFLIYEIWDHLIASYEAVENGFQHEVERIQSLLVGEVQDSIFAEVSKLGSDLLYFRKHVAPARGVLSELATRKTIYVSEATQPFLFSMVAHLERILADVIVNRDIVRDSLDLYMSMVGYRTNQVMNRLTIVTFIFLPLTFICGILGMNLPDLPETTWWHFWSIAAGVTTLVVFIMRRFRLL